MDSIPAIRPSVAMSFVDQENFEPPCFPDSFDSARTRLLVLTGESVFIQLFPEEG
jgi:hypothetical protein